MWAGRFLRVGARRGLLPPWNACNRPGVVSAPKKFNFYSGPVARLTVMRRPSRAGLVLWLPDIGCSWSSASCTPLNALKSWKMARPPVSAARVHNLPAHPDVKLRFKAFSVDCPYGDVPRRLAFSFSPPAPLQAAMLHGVKNLQRSMVAARARCRCGRCHWKNNRERFLLLYVRKRTPRRNAKLSSRRSVLKMLYSVSSAGFRGCRVFSLHPRLIPFKSCPLPDSKPAALFEQRPWSEVESCVTCKELPSETTETRSARSAYPHNFPQP